MEKRIFGATDGIRGEVGNRRLGQMQLRLLVKQFQNISIMVDCWLVAIRAKVEFGSAIKSQKAQKRRADQLAIWVYYLHRRCKR